MASVVMNTPRRTHANQTWGIVNFSASRSSQLPSDTAISVHTTTAKMPKTQVDANPMPQRIINYGQSTEIQTPTAPYPSSRDLHHSGYKTRPAGRVLNSRSRARRQAAKAAKILKQREQQLGREKEFRAAMEAIQKLQGWMSPESYKKLCDALIEPWGVSRSIAMGIDSETEDDDDMSI
jgi:hypothetical protein